MAWYLVSDFQGYFQPFTIEYDVDCKFVIHGLCHVEACYLYTHLVESFIINGYWTLSVAFYASIETITIFIFQFVNAVCHIDLFADIETFLHLWDKFYLIMVYDLFLKCCSVCINNTLLRIFASVFISDIGLWFSFLIIYLSDFVSGWCWHHRMSLKALLPLKFFWDSLRR